MVLDCHIHIDEGAVNCKDLIKRMKDAGIDGGILLSIPPDSFGSNSRNYLAGERLDNLFAWTGDHPNLYPFFWIDPVEEDAEEQVHMAINMGVKGFKVICSHHYPGDIRAMKVYSAIAATGKPILFHSGILWDGQPSSIYNRPVEFEALISVSKLKFALAHVSWPWYDENIAVYGKFEHANHSKPGVPAEMFIDTTPGTPVIYREEVFTKLFASGYHIEGNVFFGTDGNTACYNTKWAAEWIERDRKIFKKLLLSEETVEKIFSLNLMRFLLHHP